MEKNRYEVRVGEHLREMGRTLAVAESCTGGLAGHCLTNVPGSSDYFLGGVIAYAYQAKVDLLGVQWATLDKYGAVSEEVVIEMAQGARRALGADLGLSISGVAGPGGGTPEKPVGFVWIGLSTPNGDWARSFVFDKDRVGNKEHSAEAALGFLLDYLEGKLGFGTS